jgi:hypothetical protein
MLIGLFREQLGWIIFPDQIDFVGRRFFGSDNIFWKGVDIAHLGSLRDTLRL